VGFVTWRDMLEFSTRVRHAIPNTHILVDVDDGFGDEIVASNIIDNLESNGLSSIMIEDQKRPRKCGHYDGKTLLPVDEYLIKLKNILRKRKSIFVIARTDASTEKEGLFRAIKYAEAGADGVMIEGIRDLAVVRELRKKVDCPIMINQLHGGKSPNWTLEEMEEAGVSIVIYSTPCLFSSQFAIQNYLDDFIELGGLPSENTVSMNECSDVLYNNFGKKI
jgi:2-methylisocitrate lyase-like PEP mutase family enzyme